RWFHHHSSFLHVPASQKRRAGKRIPPLRRRDEARPAQARQFEGCLNQRSNVRGRLNPKSGLRNPLKARVLRRPCPYIINSILNGRRLYRRRSPKPQASLPLSSPRSDGRRRGPVWYGGRREGIELCRQ